MINLFKAWQWAKVGTLNAVVGAIARLVKTNNQAYSKGSYASYAGMWYSYIDPTFTEGDEFDANITINPATFPAGAVANWRTPNTPPALSGVYGFLHFDYGNYQYTSVPTVVTSRQLYTLTALSTLFDFTYQSSGDDGLLEEFWASTISRQGAQDYTGYYAFEIGIFRRTSASTISYMNGVTQLGTVSDGNRSWTVALDPNGPSCPYIMFRPTGGEDVKSTVNWIPLIAYLINQGVISGNEWFNGIGAGVEPHLGSGSLRVNDFTVSATGAARAPWTISNLSAAAQSATTVLLAYRNAAGFVSHEYRINGGAAVAVPGNKIITGLTGSTAYTFEVLGVNATGNGAWSNVANATTLAAGAAAAFAGGTMDDGTGWNGLWGGSGWTISGGKLVGTNVPQYYNNGKDFIAPLTADKYYEVSFDLVRTLGSMRLDFLGGTTRSSAEFSTSGTKVFRLLANAGNTGLIVMATTGAGNLFNGTIDNLTVLGPYTTATVGGA